MVYIKSDQSKSQVRDKFVVLSVNPHQKVATVQKFLGFRWNPLTIQLQNLYKACIDDKYQLIEEYHPNEEPRRELSPVSKACWPPITMQYYSPTQCEDDDSDSDDEADDTNTSYNWL